MSSQKEIPLTEEEKKKIYASINITDGDRYPYEVIRDDFGGNEDAYLRTMAKYHTIFL